MYTYLINSLYIQAVEINVLLAYKSAYFLIKTHLPKILLNFNDDF